MAPCDLIDQWLEEFASLLERALDLETTSRSFKYLDTDNHWARESIATIANLGLVPDGTRNFRPNDPLTRGEMAQILNNLIEVQQIGITPTWCTSQSSR